jgi:hypothetical protein
MPPGVEVTAAIQADVVGIHVDQAQLDCWGMTLDQVLTAAVVNLHREVAAWQGKVYEDNSLNRIPIRQLEHWPHWAITLVLVPDELKRIFGSDDQLFVAPYHCNLMSLPIDVDRDFAADLVDMFGMINPRSLLLGMPAFVLRDGELTTEELPGTADEPMDEAENRAVGSHSLSDLLGW